MLCCQLPILLEKCDRNHKNLHNCVMNAYGRPKAYIMHSDLTEILLPNGTKSSITV